MNRCLIMDHDKEHTDALAAACTVNGFEVLLPADAAEARAALADPDVCMAFLDLNFGGKGQGLKLLEASVPDSVEFLCLRSPDDNRLAEEAVKRGAGFVFHKPIAVELIEPVLRDIAGEAKVNGSGSGSAHTGCVYQFGFLRGSSPAMHGLYRVLRKVAPTDASLMVIGESGTGKELVAQTAHTLSARRDAPLIAFNCATVTRNLAESELFGHEKGSFSGASSRHRGFFEQANGGTLFLDEITEMDIGLQAKLLRVIETKTVRRLGSEECFEVDVRFVCATNRSPVEAVREGKLREDLYYRLAQFPVNVPSLRDRAGDIQGLAQYFLTLLNRKHGSKITFTQGALDRLSRCSWPGNVRELKNYVERAYIVSDSVIDTADLPEPHVQHDIGRSAPDDAIQITIPVGAALADAQRELILASLQRNQGNKKTAAEELGISLKTMYNRLREYGARDIAGRR